MPEGTSIGRSVDELFPLVYTELRALAASHLRRERPGHTLQPTALAHEVYQKLSGADGRVFAERSQFMAAAAKAIRRILTDHARTKKRKKRGGGAAREELDQVHLAANDPGIDIVDFDEALQELARLSPRAGQVVELRIFAGLTIKQVAENLGIADSTVSQDWTTARAWLRSRFT